MYEEVSLTQPGIWLNWAHLVLSVLLGILFFVWKKNQAQLSSIMLALTFTVVLCAGTLQFIIFRYGMDMVFICFGLMPQRPLWWSLSTLFFAFLYGCLLPVRQHK